MKPLLRPQRVTSHLPSPPLPACNLHPDRRTLLLGAGTSLMAQSVASAASTLGTTVRLSTGAEIPAVGLGVFLSRGGQTQQAVREALAAGYRHIDTAQLYDNEADVGQRAKDVSLRQQLPCTMRYALAGTQLFKVLLDSSKTLQSELFMHCLHRQSCA